MLGLGRAKLVINTLSMDLERRMVWLARTLSRVRSVQKGDVDSESNFETVNGPVKVSSILEVRVLPKED